jgi:hypothetical protein
MFRSMSRGLSQTRLALRTMPGRSRSLIQPIRLSSTVPSPSGGAGVKIALTGLVGVTAALGGTVGYASYDSEFRFDTFSFETAKRFTSFLRLLLCLESGRKLLSCLS